MQDMHPLEPTEMVEHLKQGLGKQEQVFTYITFWIDTANKAIVF